MKMAWSTIIDLWFFLRRRDLPTGVNGSVGRLKFSRYGSSDLASPDRSWIFSYGCREEYYPRNNFPECRILDNGDSCSRFPIDVDQAIWLLFPGILVLVLLTMVIDYFNGCMCARSLDIAAPIKIMEELSLVFLGQWFGIYLRLPPKKYNIVSWKKEFKDLEDLLVSFRHYFVIVKVSSCIYTMCYLLLIMNICGTDCKKRWGRSWEQCYFIKGKRFGYSGGSRAPILRTRDAACLPLSPPIGVEPN
jgi:hypothetical protein